MIEKKKRKLKPIYWLMIAEIIIVVVGLLLGFKITYAPHLENDWDAISAVAGWFSAIASFIAIVVAVQIPKIIAEDQNKIALFEKRYAVYEVLNNCIAYAYVLDRFNESGSDWNLWFSISFGDHALSGRELSWDEQRKIFNATSNLLRQSELLFGKEFTKQIDILENKLLLLIQAERHHDNLQCRQKEYIEHATSFEKEVLPKIKELISLK